LQHLEPVPNSHKHAATKADQILALLRQPSGATLQSITKATGWQAHSVRGFISGHLVKKLGLRVKSFRQDGERVYAIKSRPTRSHAGWLRLSTVIIEGRKLMAAKPKPRMIGRHIVADPAVCHGQPTFRGTRILVADVLEQVSSGMAWESIALEWRERISKEAIAEAVRLASLAFQDHAGQYVAPEYGLQPLR
jgi:uncharacterized protein (DUF433 family)